MLDVLRANGIVVESSCKSGLCGRCKTKYVSGIRDHRDVVLDDSERSEYVMICCSRAQSDTLVLDLEAQ
jgi:ferredoxin